MIPINYSVRTMTSPAIVVKSIFRNNCRQNALCSVKDTKTQVHDCGAWRRKGKINAAPVAISTHGSAVVRRAVGVLRRPVAGLGGAVRGGGGAVAGAGGGGLEQQSQQRHKH